ncbi:S-adenosyl-L-methionine-dependent methyltransferase [Punctularia strigosozonata HHB-11173 SS5]|uniref:S-adenosyl-L-methionine-dependent methyltransferase n=1 Tax=Punctularia strigosozonata (strain HHB-11173) TaxID=741275 RepID=UPI000441629D|nr:S-adenosyl-L-methionine-dependent methyltransferase [Punctularia strigosozonata HHB-11173 SS5]EIN12179.1 S-adenosyl-L-methionine-dependent methyltransferase [Punctularia strigosozonata HHB-11173 SS5]
MSVKLPATALDTASQDPEVDALSTSSSEDDEDENFSDWVDEEADRVPCQSLFDDTKFPSSKEALAYDSKTHGFDLDATCKTLSLDTYQRIRLINYIRKEKPAPSSLKLDGSESFLASDDYIKPVLEDDPLLRKWSDQHRSYAPSRKIRALERKLVQAKQDLADYRAFVGERLEVGRIIEAVSEPSDVGPAPRDDDSHYFESYGENDIHAVMIQDRVRTSTYASFIMKTPSVFQDAVVLDVGCGTGILSLFAARSGAKHVYAVDASPVAEKAKKIVEANDLSDVITVIRGKIEDITLPVEHVDVIISEWMGYALLYESMLDSVLVARDRFLKPKPADPTPEAGDEVESRGGILAPSQCKMMLSLCTASDVYKERIGFWNDVYGFDLSAMAREVCDEAIVDVVPEESLVSEPYTIKDIYLGNATPRSLDFTSSFKLTSTAERRTKAHAFLLYFDTFFAADGAPVPESTAVQLVKDGDVRLAEVWPVGAAHRRESLHRAQSLHRDRSQSREARPGGMSRKPSLKAAKGAEEETETGARARLPPRRSASFGEALKAHETVTSFSTGPRSVPTHWKQTVFMLREPIVVEEGTEVHGKFYCRKAPNNSRELEVEIHYAVTAPGAPPATEMVAQMFKVR